MQSGGNQSKRLFSQIFLYLPIYDRGFPSINEFSFGGDNIHGLHAVMVSFPLERAGLLLNVSIRLFSVSSAVRNGLLPRHTE